MDGQEDEGIRRKKSARMENVRQEEQEQMLRKALTTLLEPEAHERLMIVKSQNPQMYATASKWILTIAQRGGIQKKIDEQTLRMILLKISQQRRESTIEFRRKGE